MCCRRVSVVILRNWHPLEAPFGPIGIYANCHGNSLGGPNFCPSVLSYRIQIPYGVSYPIPQVTVARLQERKKKGYGMLHQGRPTKKKKKKGAVKPKRIFTCSGSLHSRMGPMDRFGSTWRTSINQCEPATGKLISGLFLGLESTGPNRACGSTTTGVSQTKNNQKNKQDFW